MGKIGHFDQDPPYTLKQLNKLCMDKFMFKFKNKKLPKCFDNFLRLGLSNKGIHWGVGSRRTIFVNGVNPIMGWRDYNMKGFSCGTIHQLKSEAPIHFMISKINSNHIYWISKLRFRRIVSMMDVCPDECM